MLTHTANKTSRVTVLNYIPLSTFRSTCQLLPTLINKWRLRITNTPIPVKESMMDLKALPTDRLGCLSESKSVAMISFDSSTHIHIAYSQSPLMTGMHAVMETMDQGSWSQQDKYRVRRRFKVSMVYHTKHFPRNIIHLNPRNNTR